jgi:hypothetical protein
MTEDGEVDLATAFAGVTPGRDTIEKRRRTAFFLCECDREVGIARVTASWIACAMMDRLRTGSTKSCERRSRAGASSILGAIGLSGR